MSAVVTFYYKGYSADVVFGENVWHGRVNGLDDAIVTFEGDYLLQAEERFHEALDDYLEYLKKGL